ncbi:MAG TPA: hypothetical protein VLL52_05955 [Anaerolineae bacterium]|nr:hypothetical protein [Anaerolineae bacterium]
MSGEQADEGNQSATAATAIPTPKGKLKRQRYATNEPPMANSQPVRPKVTNKRIEIKAVALQNGTTGLYWRWRWTEAKGHRRSSYGGKIDTLNNQERLKQYRRNRRRYQKRKAEDEQT